MQTTVQIEMEHSKRSYMDLIGSAGMRRRMLISCFLGLFTQWSGNTLISYYLSDLLSMIGKNDSLFKQQFNVASACWNLICGTTVSLLVRRFKRRHMYLTCTSALLVVYISWTISMAYAVKGKDAGVPNEAANTAVMFWIFAYAPCYNIGYNALTYSMFRHGERAGERGFEETELTCRHSLPGRDLALCAAVARYRLLPALRPPGQLLQHLRQPHRPQERQLAVPHLVLLLPRL